MTDLADRLIDKTFARTQLSNNISTLILLKKQQSYTTAIVLSDIMQRDFDVYKDKYGLDNVTKIYYQIFVEIKKSLDDKRYIFPYNRGATNDKT